MWSRRADGPSMVSTVGSAIAFAVAAGALVSYGSAPGAAHGVRDALVAMKFNSATCCFALSIALWRQRQHHDRIGCALALVVVAITAATLVEYVTGASFGIDDLGPRLLDSQGIGPPRMHALNAGCIGSLGLALCLADRRIRGFVASQWLALPPAILSSLLLLSRAFGAQPGIDAPEFLALSAPAALCLLALSCGVIARQRGVGLLVVFEGRSAASLVFRRLVPWLVAVPLAIAWLRLRGQESGYFGLGFGLALFAVSTVTVLGGLLIWATWAAMREEDRVQAIQLAAERAADASRAKSELLANMSHELRTPLNAIIGFSELMYRGKLGPISDEHREYLGDVVSNSKHLLALINDLLDLSKIEAGKGLAIARAPLDLGALAAETVDSVRALASAKHIAIALEAQPERVVADRTRIKQVLYNFLANAIKFTPDGGTVTLRISPEPDDRVRISVTDTGIGIAEEDFPRLFVAFEQLDASTAKGYQGTGLGLAMVKRIVEAHGGTVEVSSTLGVGSTFAAVFPRDV